MSTLDRRRGIALLALIGAVCKWGVASAVLAPLIFLLALPEWRVARAVEA